MNIFFDLDGTLIDSKRRLYALFQYLVQESNYTFNDYWKLKKDKVSHSQILSQHFNYGANDILKFNQRWMNQIEQKEWLDFDLPFDGMSDYLIELSKRHSLFVITARQSEAMAIIQIEGYGWSNIFQKIFVTGQKLDKYQLITSSINVSTHDWLVGDTGKDIQTGKLLGINTAAVLSGFLSEDRLLEYEPDLIVENVINLNFKDFC